MKINKIQHDKDGLNIIHWLIPLTSLVVFAGCHLHGGKNQDAETFIYQFAMHASTKRDQGGCELVERFSQKANRQLRFAGRLDDHGCWVLIPQERYNRQFQFCYLAGFNLYDVEERQSAECFIQKRDHDYAFFAGIGDGQSETSQVMCYFTCFGKKQTIQNLR